MYGTKTIHLGGEDRVLNLNLHSTFFLLKELDCELDELMPAINKVFAESPLRALGYIIYCGMKGQLESEAVFIHPFTMKDIMGWLGSADEKTLQDVWDLFKEVNDIPAASTEQIEQYAESVKKNVEQQLANQKES